MPMFVFWMIFAASLGLVKVIVIAGILPKEDFGDYVTLTSGAMLLTMLMSAGLIEGTIKRFPRLWLQENVSQIEADVRSIFPKVIWRTAILTATSTLVLLAVERIDLVVMSLSAIFLGGAGLIVRLLSSVQLAIGSLRLLTQFSIIRAVTTFLLAILGAWKFGFEGVVLGEVAAVILLVVQAWLGLKPFLSSTVSSSKLSPLDQPDYRLYIGSVMTSGTIMVDRPFINILSGPALAGSFGFAMITAQISQMLMNIISQKLGPDLIKDATGDRDQKKLIITLGKFFLFSVLFSIIIIISGLIINSVEILEPIFSKYGISSTSIILVGMICAFYIHILFEYVLIAVDQEIAVMRGSFFAMLAFSSGFFAAWFFGGLTEYYLMAALITRMSQTLWLGLEILQPRYASTHHGRT